MYKILTINPGSTSTKIAVFNDENEIFSKTIRHSAEELTPYQRIFDQYKFRKKVILQTLKDKDIALSDFSVIVGRGGFTHPLPSGIYPVNEKLLFDLKNAVFGEHASNLGGILANEIASEIPNALACITDPVTVDELQDVARISGLPQIPRHSVFHALNQKAVARMYAAEKNVKYENLHLIVAHLGGGISVGAHCKGRVIDTNQALTGFGPFAPERAGTLDAGKLVEMCFSGEYTQKDILKLLAGKGGLVAHLNTNDVRDVLQMIEAGNEHAKIVLEAMAYQVGREIGSMHVVLKGKTDAVILTGGIAHCQLITDYISDMVSSLAPVIIYPGEDEMKALALAGLRALNGEKTLVY